MSESKWNVFCLCKEMTKKWKFFYKQCFFFNSASMLLNFLMNWALLLKCCLIHISIIIHVLYLLHLCPCLDLRLFLSYLSNLFFIFIFIFIMINRIASWIQTHLFFCLLFKICPLIICLIFSQYQSSVAYESVAYKKNV